MSRDMRAFTYGVAAITAVFLGCALVGALVCGIFPSAYRDFHVGDFGAVGAVAMCALAGAGVTVNAKPAFTPPQAARALAAIAYPGSVDFGANNILNIHDDFVTAKRLAATKAHPDRGGKPEDWESYTEAVRVLEAHHNGK